MTPETLTVTYRPHFYDCVLACYPRVHARNFRMPLSDAILKSRAIPDATIRLHKLFQRAMSLVHR